MKFWRHVKDASLQRRKLTFSRPFLLFLSVPFGSEQPLTFSQLLYTHTHARVSRVFQRFSKGLFPAVLDPWVLKGMPSFFSQHVVVRE